MQNIGANLANAVAQELTYLCRIWKLELANGTVFRFTDLDRDLIYDGEVYECDPGVRVSSVVVSREQSDNAEVSVAASANFLSKTRLHQGALDGASFTLWVTDWRNPDFYGLIELFAGQTGELKFHDKGKANIGLTSDLGGGIKNIGEAYSRFCRAQLGDARCKVNLPALGVSITVLTVTDNGYGFTASALSGLTDNYLKFGRVNWLTGNNANLGDELASNVQSTSKAVIATTPRNPIAVGDTGTVFPGCDKTVEMCGPRFNNLLNFRGEPYAPASGQAIFVGRVVQKEKFDYETHPTKYGPAPIRA